MANTKVVGSNTPKKRFFRILMVILIIGLCLLMLSPFIWMIGASLKKRSRCYETGSWIIPHLLVSPELFTGTWVCGKDKLSFLQGYWNSIKVAAISAAVAGVSSCLAGYAFAKLKVNKIAARWPAKAVAQFFYFFLKKAVDYFLKSIYC